MTLGLSFGTFLPSAAYSQLALIAHIQYMINSFLCVLMALLLWPDYLSLSRTRLKTVLWSANSSWAVLVLETLSAWQGRTETSSIVSDDDASVSLGEC